MTLAGVGITGTAGSTRSHAPSTRPARPARTTLSAGAALSSGSTRTKRRRSPETTLLRRSAPLLILSALILSLRRERTHRECRGHDESPSKVQFHG